MSVIGAALSWVLAQSAGGTPDGGSQIVELAQYGVLGLVVLGFIFGWIVPKPTHDAVRRDLEKREAQLDALVATYEKEIIPVLSAVNEKILDLAAKGGRAR